MSCCSSTLAVGVCLALFSCGKPASTHPGERPPTPPVRKLRLAFVTNNASQDWAAARAGCNRAVADLPNVSLDFQLLADGSAATQKRVVDDLLARGTDGIAICPVDPVAEAPMLRDAARQTLLFTVGIDAPESGRACFFKLSQFADGHVVNMASEACGQRAVSTLGRALMGDEAAIPPGRVIVLPP